MKKSCCSVCDISFTLNTM